MRYTSRRFALMAAMIGLCGCLCLDSLRAAQPQNVLLLCVDDLRPELNCYGVDYIRSPHIDQLASAGRIFTRHYVQAPTCGASRYALLTGHYGRGGNDDLFQRAALLKAGKPTPVSLPEWFRQHGYTTVSVGKVSHHPGGRGGAHWNDDTQPEMPAAWVRHLMPVGPWQHPEGAMHGLAHGEIRQQAGEMDLFQSEPGEDSIYPDGLITAEALSQLDRLTADTSTPFLLAVGLIRPHLPFGAPQQYMQPYREAELPAIPHPEKPDGPTTWHTSSEFMKYNRWGRDPNHDAAFATEVRKHYAACVSYADAQVGEILARLKQNGAWENTLVVLWGDHGWHLGEHAVWGKHTLYEESLRSPLIIRTPNMAQAGAATAAVVESIDLFPTLCELSDIPLPAGLAGSSLVPALEDPQTAGHSAISYFKRNRTLRSDSHRLIAHADGALELYDHRSDPDESHNVARQQAELAQQLLEQLDQRRPAWPR